MALRFEILAGIAAALAGALGIAGSLLVRRKSRFPYMAHPLSGADYSAMAGKPGWRAHSLAVAPGVALQGLVREPTTPAQPWILFFGGNSAQVLMESQQVLDALCAERGWGGCVWAYRGFDSSGGAPDPVALQDDALKAYLALLAEQQLQPASVHLVGYSLGTSIAASVAARAQREPPASLILLAPLTRVRVGARTQLRLHSYETGKWLRGIKSTVLVIHGIEDTVLGVEGARAVARGLGSRARLLELPGIGHSDLPFSTAAQEALRAFIDQKARPEGCP